MNNNIDFTQIEDYSIGLAAVLNALLETNNINESSIHDFDFVNKSTDAFLEKSLLNFNERIMGTELIVK